jgi:plastocyanin
MALTKLQSFNIDSTVNFTFANLTSGNANLGNAVTANYFIGNLYGTANLATYATTANAVAGANVSGAVSFATTANSVSGANVTGNVGNALNAFAVSGANVTGNVGNALNAFAVAGANVSGAVAFATTANSVAGANVSGQVANSLVAGTVYTNAQPNITSVGTLTDLNVSGNAIITGNLVVGGAVEYTNVNNLYIKDPIIEQGGGTNSAALTTNDGKDRGSLLHYYTSTTVDAFMGWDNSNAEFAFGSNVTVASEVVTFNTLGNVRVGNLLGPLAKGNSNVNIPSANGNINLTAVGNTTMVVTGTGANVTGTANISGNLSAGNTNAGNLLTANNLSVTSYVTSNLIPDANITYNLGSSTNRWKDLWLSNSTLYFDTESTMSAGTITNGRTSIGIPVANVNISFSTAGNTTLVVTATGANVTGTANVSGNLSAGNANLGNAVIANYFVGNGSELSAINFSNITTFSTAGLTTDKLYLQSTTRLNVTASGASGYLFDQYGEATVNPTIYVTSGQTIAFNLNVSGHPFLIQTNSSINYSTGLEHVSTTGTVSLTSTAQGKISGTLYWKVPYGITGNYKYQCSIHGGMNGNIVVSDANLANITVSLAAFANTAGVANTANAVTGANVSGQVANALVAGTVYSASQPNITSVGNLTSLAVGGAVTAVSFTANTYFAGNGNGLSNITGANVTGAVPYATTANAVAGANVSDAVAYATTANAVAGANVSGAVNYAITANNVAGANVTGQVSNSLVTGTVYTNAQPNITSIGTLTGLTVTGNTAFSGANVSLGAIGNIKITGGTDGQFLQTDGSGILRWAAISADGLGVASITNGNSAVGIATANGNVTINVASNTTMIITGTGANITGTANITGNLRAGNANIGNAVSANYFVGTVYTANQPNITSVGTLTGLLSTGNINFTVASNIALGSVENVHITGGSSGQYLQTDGSGVLTWATIATSGGGTATISNGNSNINIAVADGNVNVSAVGNANVLVVSGTGANITGNLSADNATLGNLVTANFVAGTLTTAAQPNITSVGTLTGITSTGTANFAGASNVSLGPVANVKISGGSSGYVLRTDGAGNLSWTAQASGGNGGGVGGSSIISGTTSVDIPSASGNINFTSDGNTIVVVSGTGANITGNLEVTGSNVSLGTVGNLKIAGGTPGQVLQTDGAGNLSWKTAGSGQGGTGFLYVYTRSQINATINVISRYVTIGRRSGNTQVVVS